MSTTATTTRTKAAGKGATWKPTPPRATRTRADGETLYQCTWCEAWLPAERFHRLVNPKSLCGLNSWCRKCHNRSRTERRKRQRARDEARKARYARLRGLA